MNIITRAKNWVFGVVATVSPTDADGNGRSDAVDRLDAVFESFRDELGEVTIEQVIAICASVAGQPLEGQQKHGVAVLEMQEIAKGCAIWVLNAVVAVAYGKMTAELSKKQEIKS